MLFKPVPLLVSLSFFMPVAAWASSSESLTQLAMFNFGGAGCDNCDWFVVVDGVMGGRSSAELKTTENSIVLSGDISLDNRGGFASIRTPYDDYDLSE